MLEAQVYDLLNERYPGLRWHHLRVYSQQNGFAATMHVTMPPRITVEAAHRLAEEAEATLRTQINDLDRVTIHTEPPENDKAQYEVTDMKSSP
jgi:divalent metal cation (Fe/Co/Zn/Cd) transporter